MHAQNSRPVASRTAEDAVLRKLMMLVVAQSNHIGVHCGLVLQKCGTESSKCSSTVNEYTKSESACMMLQLWIAAHWHATAFPICSRADRSISSMQVHKFTTEVAFYVRRKGMC